MRTTAYAMRLAQTSAFPTDSLYGFSVEVSCFSAGRMDLLQFNLERALGKEGCAICRLRQEAEARYLFSFLWEFVNDPGVREHLVNALGFCHAHAWQLQETEQNQFGSGLGTAIVYEDLMRHALANIGRLQAKRERSWFTRTRRLLGERLAPETGRARRRALPGGLVPREECRVCVTGRSTEQSHLQSLLDHCADTRFREQFRASDGLCLPHLRGALEIAEDDAARAFLMETAQEQVRTLANQLREYIRKHSWDHRDEPKLPEEQSAWIRAVEFFAGKKSV